jgi:hypothetical protein
MNGEMDKRETPDREAWISDIGRQTLSPAIPTLFTRDFTLLCLITSCYFSSFFFFFPTLPFSVKHLGGQEYVSLSDLYIIHDVPTIVRTNTRDGKRRVVILNLRHCAA